MSVIAKTGENAIVNQRLRRIQARVVKLLEDGTIQELDKENGLYLQEVSGNQELFFSGNQLTENGKVLQDFDISGTEVVLRSAYSNLNMSNKPITEIKCLDLVSHPVLPADCGSALVDVSGSLYFNGNLVYSDVSGLNHPWEIQTGTLYTNPRGLNLNIDQQTTTQDLVVNADTSLNNLVFDVGEAKDTFTANGLVFQDGSGETLQVQTMTSLGDLSCNSTTKTQNLNVYGNGNYYGISVFNSIQVSNDTNLNGTLYANSNSDFDGHAQFNSSATITGVLTGNGAVDLNSTLDVQGTAAFDGQVSTNGALIVNGTGTLNGNITQEADYTTGTSANTYISDQDRFYWYESDWVNHINPTTFASGGYVDSATFSGSRTAGYKTQDLMTNYPGYFYLYKSWNRVVNETSYNMSVGGSVDGVSSQNRAFTPRYTLNSSTLYNTDGGSVSPADENLLECDNLSVGTMLTSPRFICSNMLVGTAEVNNLQNGTGLFDFLDGAGSTFAQIVDAISALGGAVIVGGSIVAGSILAGGLAGAGAAYGGSKSGSEQRADGTASNYNSAFWGKPTESPYDLSYASYYEQPLGYALTPSGEKLEATDADMDNLLYTFGINQKNSTMVFNAVSQTNELSSVITTLPEATIYGNADKGTGINYPVVGNQVLTGWSHTPKLYSLELNDYTTAFSGKYLDINTREYENLPTTNRIYSVDGNLYHSGKRVGDQLPAVIKLGESDGGLDDVMGISMETASGFSPAKNYFIGTQNGTYGMDAIQSNSLDSLGKTLGVEMKVGSEYYIDLAGTSTGANTDPSSVVIYKPLILDDGVNAKYNLGDWVYDLSVNGTGGGVFTGSGTTATLQATYTTLDASQADVNYGSLQSRYNSASTSGLTTIEPTSSNTLTIKSEQPPSSSIGSRVILNAENPTYGNRDTLEVNGYYDQAICYGNLFIADSNTTSGRYQHPLMYFGGTNRSYPSTDQALWFSNTTNTLNWETNYILTTNTSGYLDLQVGSLGIDTGDILRWKDIKSTPIATKLMRIEGLDYVDSGYDKFLEFDCSSATPILTMGDSGAGQITADWNIKANQGVWLPDTSQTTSSATLTNQSGDLYWGTQKLAEASGHLPLTGGTLTGQLSIEYNTAADPMLTLRKSNQNSASTILIKNDYNSNEIQIGSQQLVPYYGITYKNIISASGDLLIVSNSSNSHWEMGTTFELKGQNNAIDFADVYIGTPSTGTLYIKDISYNLGIGTRTILDSANWSDYVSGGGGGAADDNYFYSSAGTITMDVSSTFQNINFNQLTPCKVFNSGDTLQLTGGGSTYASMLLDSTSNEQIDFDLGTSSPGSTILRIKDDATNYNPTLNVVNTNTSNSECSIQVNQAASASYLAKFGVNNAGQAFIYDNTDRIQLYINGGTALTLVKTTSNNISFSPDAWSSGSNHFFGLGDTTGNATYYGRYLTFSYNDGIRYYTNGGKHEFNHGGTAQCYIDTNGLVSSNSLTSYPYIRLTASNNIIEHRRAIGDIWYSGINSGNSSYEILNSPIGGRATLDRGGNLYVSGSYSSSDRRIKKDIELIKDDEALQIVKKIEPKTYKYIDERLRGTDKVYGFIAQEVKAAFPPAVSLTHSAIPTIQQWFDISGDVITFSTPVDISANTQIQVAELSGEIIDPSGETGSKVDIGDIWAVKQLAPNKYQVNQQINYKKGYCVGVYVDDFHSITQQKLFPILWAATQEQQRTIERQAEYIAKQQLDITNMKQKLARIEQLLLANNIK